jgi:alkylated DNA repair dioxygenase AlkB
MLSLFPISPDQNLLPYEGEVYYYADFFTPKESHDFLRILTDEIPWKHDEVVIFGKVIQTLRKVAWYADYERPYTYSGRTKIGLPWTPTLLTIKSAIEEKAKIAFNGGLMNYYHDGNEGASWHSDNEKTIKANSCIASVSFGAARKFEFKHKQTQEKVSLELAPGSLLLMQGTTQTHWIHQLPKSKKIKEPRLNLTFRQMI